MINRLEIHSTWNNLVQAWKTVWGASRDLEAWAAFMPHCDQLASLAIQNGVTELEDALAPLLALLEDLGEPGDAEKARVDRLLPQVFAVVRAVCSDDYERRLTRTPHQDEVPPLVVMLSRDTQSLQELLLQMEHYGYTFKVYTQYTQGVKQAIQRNAAAVVIDVGKHFSEETLALTDELNRRHIKWFALSEQGDFSLRLEAVRHQAQGYFVAPLSVNALADAVDPLAFKAKEDPYRVLILDDSATVVATIQKALSQVANIHARGLQQPALILENLLDFSPDVLLLDFHMDNCNGLEVAKIIRQNKAFESVPIVFLTSETRESIQLEAMRHGGDDYLTKPISQAQLVNTVVSKAERYRGLRRLMVEDSLTGLYNHVKTKALLQQSLLLADRHDAPLCYAIIDIDHFKRVNDTYGHTVGDKVIKTLARFLKQRVRRSDVVGRYGGEEFVLVMMDSSPEDAFDRLEAIRKGFGGIFHSYDEGIFASTFSGGIAHFPAYGSMTELMVAADEALYESKRNGRNRITLATKSR